MKWKMVTYYKESNGHEDSITDYVTATVRQARQIRKNCEQLCNELVKRKSIETIESLLKR